MYILKKIMILFVMITISMITMVSAETDQLVDEMEIQNEAQTQFELIDTVKRSKYNALMAGEERIESSYDLRNNLPYSIKVKNQLNSNSCWAFSFSSVLETSIAKQRNIIPIEISPMHIEYTTTQMYNRTLGSGAGSRLSVAYAVSGRGPVKESEMPFESVYIDNLANNIEDRFIPVSHVGNLNKPLEAKINKTVDFSSIYKKRNNNVIQHYKNTEYKDQYQESEVNSIRTLIKQHVKEYGAVSADIYMESGTYFDQTNNSYNYDDYINTKNANHVVAIVGWDDNYSKDKFKSGHKPTNNGAYIALNSYGSNWGDGGYMYISYEDAIVESAIMGIQDVKQYTNNVKDYTNIYQYDDLGANLGIPLVHEGDSLYAASLYRRKNNTSNSDEYINEIGLYIVSTSGVTVYINPDASGSTTLNSAVRDINNAEAVTGEQVLEAGYHVIKLATPIKITGDKFIVKVKYTNSDKDKLVVPLEVNYGKYGLENATKLFDKATANELETFISNGSVWGDVEKVTITDLSNNKSEQHSLEDSSACIKAFTTVQNKSNSNTQSPSTVYPTTESTNESIQNYISVDGISLDRTYVEVEEGEKFNLTATVLPTNATNKSVQWRTSDSRVIQVSDYGVITAVSEGQAILTALTVDGNKQAYSTIKVLPASSSDDDIYFSVDGDYKALGGYSVSNNATQLKSSDDSTTATISIPEAGRKILIISIISIIVLVSIVVFIKYRKLKDV